MSSALSIAAVTAVLKGLIDNRLIELGLASTLGDVNVTALPPDRISVGTDERSQLNLFLYRVTPNTGWRRGRLALGDGQRPAPPEGPGPDQSRAEGESGPALALDLHYLLTAYGEQDFQAEILLGHAMQLLHETTVLTRDRIRGTLAASNGQGGLAPAARAALGASTLAEQVQEIQVTPEFASTEEMSRLWSALQARYRPSASYKVSAVLLTAAPNGKDGQPPGDAARQGSQRRPAAAGRR